VPRDLRLERVSNLAFQLDAIVGIVGDVIERKIFSATFLVITYRRYPLPELLVKIAKKKNT